MRLATSALLLGSFLSLAACGSADGAGTEGDEQDVQETDKGLPVKDWDRLIGVWVRIGEPSNDLNSDKVIKEISFSSEPRNGDIPDNLKGDYIAYVTFDKATETTALPFTMQRLEESTTTKCADGSAAPTVTGRLAFNTTTGTDYLLTFSQCPNEKQSLHVVWFNTYTDESMTMEFLLAEL